MTDRQAHANSFGPVADLYERARPPYPAEALDWLLPAGATRVLDLGAGTGKLARQLHTRGLDVTAVEPSEGMLGQLRRVLPGVPAIIGTAESVPMADHTVDAVLVAQAWHWVDTERAVPEAARVLTRGGRLCLLWNQRDQRRDWVRRLGEIIGVETPPTADIGAPFGPATTAEFRWTHRIGPDELLDLVASRSSVILLRPDERAAVLGQVRQLAATHPELVGRTSFDLPYVTRCVRADLPGA
ncbi:class I SAM-dependent methyltransferase [Mangrovihabitans endophyticus]|nr:class I SAM-dependent methyltransferase [Mangrovihabitans endophyticus]